MVTDRKPEPQRSGGQVNRQQGSPAGSARPSPTGPQPAAVLGVCWSSSPGLGVASPSPHPSPWPAAWLYRDFTVWHRVRGGVLPPQPQLEPALPTP